jgi:TatD DNase family protein
MIPFTDTHCHLNFERFDKDRSQVIERAWGVGITWILNPGIDLETNQAAISLAQAYSPKISAAVGIHPNYGKPWTPNILPTLRNQAKQPGVVAIGEIGLDYYREHTPFEQQRIMLQEQLDLAAEFNLPVIIHNRESTEDLIAILDAWHQQLIASNHPLAERPGVFHSFDGDFETAEVAMGMNFFIGISGPVTFKNASEQKALVRNLPIDHLLLETDAPFLTPHPHRGKRNEPAFIPLIAEVIAQLHEISLEEVAERTYANAMQLFRPFAD